MEGPKPKVFDLSIDEIKAMLIDDVTEQTTRAEAQAKADSDEGEKARRSGKPVKRKKATDTNKSLTRKGLPSTDPDKGKRLA